ncbi:MAG: nitrate- and nitrite sensing domain-containing protein [Labedaea sp.]
MTETARPGVSGPEIPSNAGERSGSPSPSLPRLLLSWRDWNIPAKLAAVTLVPIVFAIVLGAMQIGDQVHRADSYRRVDRLVAVDEQLRPLVNTVQQERMVATEALAAGKPGAVPAEQRRDVDNGRDALLRAIRRATFQNDTTTARFVDVSDRLGELPGLRAGIAAGSVDAPAALAGYTAIIDVLLNFDRATGAEVLDPTLAATAAARHDLERAKEDIRYQQALVGIGLARGGLAVDQTGALQAAQSRLADRLAQFQLDATAGQRQEYAALIAGQSVANRDKLVTLALAAEPGGQLGIDPADWNLASEYTATRTGAMSSALGGQLAARSAALQNDASDGAGLASVILLIALVVAGAVMLIIGRHLLRSLRVLRRSALDVAEHGLPAAMARIRDGRGDRMPAVEPVPVRSTDEVGQVARAFDAVHRQALRLATEQAGLRARYSDVFVNLSRRSQGLVQRQLQLLERLERDEEDPEQLATLFQLDHLATRMRRNNENLMVLSGSELGRRNQRPATLADLLRAAVSEIEQYQRVLLLPAPDVLIVGYAVGDLVRLVAELLDNATAFSAPETQVTVAGHAFTDGSVCIAILDEGIGMSESELATANAKLADPRTVDVSISRRMGLFVVGRLAGRHGVEVSLHGGDNIQGVRATVSLPVELVTARPIEPPPPPPTPPPPPDPPPPAPPEPPLPAATNGHGPVNSFRPHPASTPEETKPVNGSSMPDLEAWLLDPEPLEHPAEDETPPLPRRSPGASAFAKPVDTEGGPVDLAMPGACGGPAGDSLFQPDTAGWEDMDELGGHSGLPAVEETTPIFDEMVSAWFRVVSDESGVNVGDEIGWRFAADAGFHAAQEVSLSTPDTFTDSGLPRRNPRQNLVPGSAGTADPDPVADLDPVELRDRLSSYQLGVNRARDERAMTGDDGADDADDGPPTLDLSSLGWRFAPHPAEVTSGGLPRRAARGSTHPVGGDPPPRSDRAVELRGRLGNFQRGLSRGRRSLAEFADRAGVPGDEFAASHGMDDKQYETGD